MSKQTKTDAKEQVIKNFKLKKSFLIKYLIEKYKNKYFKKRFNSCNCISPKSRVFIMLYVKRYIIVNPRK